MHFGKAERSPRLVRTFITRETNDRYLLPNVRGMPEMLKIGFSLRLRGVTNLRLCFAVVGIQNVLVYG